MKRTIAITLAIVATLGVSACGGSSGSSTPKQTADCNANAGTASGDALVGQYSAAKFQVATFLSQTFTAWVNAKAAQSGGPKKPLCPLERQVVADVVLRYAAQHQARFAADSSATSGGKNIVAYLKSQGVDCDSQCDVKETTKDAQLQAANASSTKRADAQTGQSLSACTQAEAAGLKLSKDAIRYDQQGNGFGGTNALTADLAAFAQSIKALEPRASGSKKAQLAAGEYEVQANEDQPAVAVALGLANPKIKRLPNLIGSLCG